MILLMCSFHLFYLHVCARDSDAKPLLSPLTWIPVGLEAPILGNPSRL